MSLDDPTLSIENNESIHKKHKIFSDNKYFRNKYRRGKKNKQRLRYAENQDERGAIGGKSDAARCMDINTGTGMCTAADDRRGGIGRDGDSESDYNTQEQTTPLKMSVRGVDGDSRRQLDIYSEFKGGMEYPGPLSRGRAHTVKSASPSTSLSRPLIRFLILCFSFYF